MTCTPPPGTKTGTLCVLRRGPWRCIGAWDGAGYTLARPNAGAPAGTLIDVHIPHAAGCRCGWVFAGTMPELPPRPQTAQEIAREQLGRSYPSDAACISALKIALERIRDMPESP